MKKIFVATSDPWFDNDLRYIEVTSDRISKPYLLQREGGGRMSRKTKNAYRTHVRPVVRETIAEILLQTIFEEIPDVHSN